MFTGREPHNSHKTMTLNITDESPYGQSWYWKEASSAEKTNYIYDSGEDYFFGTVGTSDEHIDTLIINDTSSNWDVVTQPYSLFTFVNPTSVFSSDQIMLGNVDYIEFSDQTISLNSGNTNHVTFTDPYSTKGDDTLTLEASPREVHIFIYRGGSDKITGRTDQKEAIIINADSSEFTINETSSGITFVNSNSIFSRDELQLENIDLINFNDKLFTLEPLQRDFGTRYNEIIGSASKDKLKGTASADKITGLGGNDVINGKQGDDFIDPGIWTTGKFDKVKGGSGSDTFVIKDGYWAFIKDFNVIEDKLDVSGLSEGFNWDNVGNKTYIWGDNGYAVARFKGSVDLSRANLV